MAKKRLPSLVSEHDIHPICGLAYSLKNTFRHHWGWSTYGLTALFVLEGSTYGTTFLQTVICRLACFYRRRIVILTDLNRDGGIGANCYLLSIGPFNVVIDAGIHPKRAGLESLPDLKPLRGKRIDLVILTHCHLDHLGALPVLLREHPNAPVVMTQASMVLAERMLHNSCNVMMRQRDETGIKDYPFYTHGDVERISKKFVALMPDHTKFFHSLCGETLMITLHRSGHVPGAVGFTLEFRKRRLFVSSDTLFDDLTILPGAKFPHEKADAIIIETTRGATERAQGCSRAEEMQRMVRLIQETVAAKGHILFPVFALGRMQELVAYLAAARRAGELPEIPVFVSGLGIDLADYFDQIARKVGGLNFERNYLKQLQARKVSDDMKPGRQPKGSALYLLSSGMMVENTPSYRVCASLLGDSRNTVCFSGYCDPDTPGGQLLEAKNKGDSHFLFKALDYKSKIAARIEKLDISSHADREELVELAMSKHPATVVLSHGDQDARDWFRDTLSARLPKARILDPQPLKPCELISEV
ncbi:MAG: MBL fold metallo-hydrolase [Verrucomicrobia bacterium]|nr:MBL fold metallo-hydrolase [Verrucomicrobiota bacterium]